MKTLLVIFLVVSPVDIPTDWVPKEADSEYWEALKFVAWHLELSGPRCPWINNFRSELCWARSRYKESKDWPPIGEVLRLPPQEICQEYLRFGRSHRNWLGSVSNEKLWADLSEDKRQADICLQFWELAREAMQEDTFWCRRRGSLHKIRLMVGEDTWHAGRWPPPAPLWNWHY